MRRELLERRFGALERLGAAFKLIGELTDAGAQRVDQGLLPREGQPDAAHAAQGDGQRQHGAAGCRPVAPRLGAVRASPRQSVNIHARHSPAPGRQAAKVRIAPILTQWSGSTNGW